MVLAGKFLAGGDRIPTLLWSHPTQTPPVSGAVVPVRQRGQAPARLVPEPPVRIQITLSQAHLPFNLLKGPHTTPAKRYLLPLLALLLALPLVAQEPNRNVRFGMPSPA